MLLIEVQEFGTGNRYGLEVSHRCRKRVKTKSQKFWRLIPAFVKKCGKLN